MSEASHFPADPDPHAYLKHVINDAVDPLLRSIDMRVELAVKSGLARATRLRQIYPDPVARPFILYGDWSETQPKRDNTLHLTELAPGLRVVKYNDKLINRESGAEHWVVMDYPQMERADFDGPEIVYTSAYRVNDHAKDMLSPTLGEAKLIPLSHWGMVPDSERNMYDTSIYIERYVPEAGQRLAA